MRDNSLTIRLVEMVRWSTTTVRPMKVDSSIIFVREEENSS